MDCNAKKIATTFGCNLPATPPNRPQMDVKYDWGLAKFIEAFAAVIGDEDSAWVWNDYLLMELSSADWSKDIKETWQQCERLAAVKVKKCYGF